MNIGFAPFPLQEDTSFPAMPLEGIGEIGDIGGFFLGSDDPFMQMQGEEGPMDSPPS